MGPLYFIAAFVLAGIVVIFAIYYSKGMKMTSYMDGEVVSAEDCVVRDEHERREETHLVLKYAVRGQEYRIQHILRGQNAKAYPPGKIVTVWYNPTSPEMAKVKQV